MRIFISGTTGFIGSNVMQFLLEGGYNVFGCGRKQITGANDKYISCDLSKKIPTQKAEIVIHIAGLCPAKENNFNMYFENNIMATRNIINYAKQQEAKRVIYIGTLASYGTVDNVLKEDSPHNDPDDYGLTKYVAEKLVKNSGLPYYILYVPTVVGEGSKNNWIMRAARIMCDNGDVGYYNGHEWFNNIVEVSDLCNFIELLLEKNEHKSDTYLLGSKEKTTIKDILLFLKSNLSSTSQLLDNGENGNAFHLDIEKALLAGFDPKSMNEILDVVCKEVLKTSKI